MPRIKIEDIDEKRQISADELRKILGGGDEISSLRTAVSAQAMFYQSDLDGDGYDYATSLGPLMDHGLVDNVLGVGEGKGNVFPYGPVGYCTIKQ
jgi:hypothetical protein